MAEAEVLLSDQTGSETAKVAAAHRALELLQVRQTSGRLYLNIVYKP